jgi:hypothetical protein
MSFGLIVPKMVIERLGERSMPEMSSGRQGGVVTK